MHPCWSVRSRPIRQARLSPTSDLTSVRLSGRMARKRRQRNLDVNPAASSDVGDNFEYQASIVRQRLSIPKPSTFCSRTPRATTPVARNRERGHRDDRSRSVRRPPMRTARARERPYLDAADGSIRVTDDYFNGLQAGDVLHGRRIRGQRRNLYGLRAFRTTGSTIFPDAPGFVDETAAGDIAFGGTIAAPMVFAPRERLSTPTSYDLSIAWVTARRRRLPRRRGLHAICRGFSCAKQTTPTAMRPPRC